MVCDSNKKNNFSPDEEYVLGRRIPLLEMFARIDAVDMTTLKRVANRYIYDRDPAVAAMGPIFTLPDYNWIRRRTFWNRY
jgi:processing peptidase subunit beta